MVQNNFVPIEDPCCDTSTLNFGPSMKDPRHRKLDFPQEKLEGLTQNKKFI